MTYYFSPKSKLGDFFVDGLAMSLNSFESVKLLTKTRPQGIPKLSSKADLWEGEIFTSQLPQATNIWHRKDSLRIHRFDTAHGSKQGFFVLSFCLDVVASSFLMMRGSSYFCKKSTRFCFQYLFSATCAQENASHKATSLGIKYNMSCLATHRSGRVQWRKNL